GGCEQHEPAQEHPLAPDEVAETPASSRKPPKVIRYPSRTQVRLLWEKLRSCWIEGSATFTIVASSTIISCPRQRTASAIQRRRSLRRSASAEVTAAPAATSAVWATWPAVRVTVCATAGSADCVARRRLRPAGLLRSSCLMIVLIWLPSVAMGAP